MLLVVFLESLHLTSTKNRTQISTLKCQKKIGLEMLPEQPALQEPQVMRSLSLRICSTT